jgi:hypothetical protein
MTLSQREKGGALKKVEDKGQRICGEWYIAIPKKQTNKKRQLNVVYLIITHSQNPE